MKRLLPCLLVWTACDVPVEDAPPPPRPTLSTLPDAPKAGAPNAEPSTAPNTAASAEKNPRTRTSDPTAAKNTPPIKNAADAKRSAVVPEGTSATVTSITDGDTIRVRVGKKNERVRLIGIDTPETRNSPRGPQPFADEATDALKSLLGRGRVRLVFDAKERDHYGRLLAYVYASDGTFVNEAMLRAGWAKALRVPPNVAHAKAFARLERQARREGAGMWAR